MPRFILAFAISVFATFATMQASFAQRAMAHKLPRPTAATKPTLPATAPHSPSMMRALGRF
jgi:hypothetical protein